VDWSDAAAFYNWQVLLERPALRAAVVLADPQLDDDLLDVGTGTGGLLREFARHPGRPRRAVGVDASAAMLEHVPALPREWTLQQADARRLPFADAAFAIVMAAYLLHVVDAVTRQVIIGECRRVLRDGGRLVSVTPSRPRRRVARMLYAPLAAASSASSSGPGAGFRPLDPRGELEEAGFTITATTHVGRGYPSLCVRAVR
jgi:ubiquinone/menaquinone biosynthesis C-methylase UbiE